MKKMHDLGMKLNPTLPRQKKYSTMRLLDQKLGIIFKEETSKLLNFVSQLCVVRQLGQFRKYIRTA